MPKVSGMKIKLNRVCDSCYLSFQIFPTEVLHSQVSKRRLRLRNSSACFGLWLSQWHAVPIRRTAAIFPHLSDRLLKLKISTEVDWHGRDLALGHLVRLTLHSLIFPLGVYKVCCLLVPSLTTLCRNLLEEQEIDRCRDCSYPRLA